MRILQQLSFPLVIALAAACSGGSSGGQTVEFRVGDITLCCDPSQGAPGKIGEFTIRTSPPADLDPATVEARFGYSLVGGSSARMSLPQGVVLGDAPVTADILLDDCDFEDMSVVLEVTVTGRRLDTREPRAVVFSSVFRIVNTCPQPARIPPQILVEEIVGSAVSNFENFTMPAPTGIPTGNSDPSIARRIPDAVTEVFQIGFVVVDLDQAQLDAAFLGPNAKFPVGNGPHGRTLAPQFPAPMTPGRYALTWQCPSAPIPLADPVHDYQFSYVTDSDLLPGNNYFGSAPWTADYWNNTDLQYSAQYDPATDWRLQVTRSNGSGGLQAILSSARVVLYDQVNLFVIPWSESGSPPEFEGRHTAFTSDGSAGQGGGYWSGDQTPEQPQLIRYSWQLSF